jgi:hypothetical protein
MQNGSELHTVDGMTGYLSHAEVVGVTDNWVTPPPMRWHVHSSFFFLKIT